MSRNGSGTYSLPVNSWNPATNGVSATAADWQSLIDDVEAALTQSVSKDGQTTMTGNLQMGGFKLTGLGAGSATGQSVRWEQLFAQGTEADIASATTTTLGTQNSNFLRVTGTTTITSFGTTYNGPRFLRFEGILTLTHSSTLILPTGANITTAAGDLAIAIPKATLGTPDGWYVFYQRADGTSLLGVTPAQIQAQTYTAFTTGGTATAYTLTPNPALTALTANQKFRVKFNAANTSTTPTLAVSGLAATAIKVWAYDNSKRDPLVGEFAIDSLWDFEYDGTNWVGTAKAAQASDSTPLAASGSGGAGTDVTFARGNHFHPETSAVPRGYIAGLTMSTAGSSTTFSVAAGMAADSTNVKLMDLTAAISKTTGSWAVGTGNGSLDGGSIAANTWYHTFLIRRTDTDVEDILTSLAPGKNATITMTIATPGVVTWTGHGLQANAPIVFTTTGALPTGVTAGTVYYVLSTSLTNDTFRFAATRGGAAINTSGTQSGVHTGTSNPELPTSYTQWRRIGSMRTNGSSQWTKFVQYDDLFIWDAAVLDVSSTGVSASAAVTRSITVPPSFNVEAFGIARLENTTTADVAYFIATSLQITDVAPADTATPLADIRVSSGTNYIDLAAWQVVTDTSRQIRTRCGTSGNVDSLRMTTEGWYDSRGKTD